MKKLVGVVPAAGRGTRLLSLTKDQPKALLLLNNKPLIQYALNALIEWGVAEIVVVIGYKGDDVRRFVESLSLSLPIHFVEQRDLNGLPGAILAAEKYLGEMFVVYPPDNLFTDNQKENLNVHIATGADTTLLYKEKVTGFSRSCLNVLGGNVQSIGLSQPGIKEKITVGLSFHSIEFLQYLRELPRSSKGECEMRDAIVSMLQDGRKVVALPVIGKRLEITTPDDYQFVSRVIADGSVSLFP